MTNPLFIVCPGCRSEMLLIGIEQEDALHDLYSFECPRCEAIETLSVLMGKPPFVHRAPKCVTDEQIIH